MYIDNSQRIDTYIPFWLMVDGSFVRSFVRCELTIFYVLSFFLKPVFTLAIIFSVALVSQRFQETQNVK
jgi:hypothetical protein